MRKLYANYELTSTVALLILVTPTDLLLELGPLSANAILVVYFRHLVVAVQVKFFYRLNKRALEFL